MNNHLELKQMLEEAAKLGAKMAIEQMTLSMMNLENPNTDQADMSDERGSDMERIKKRVVVNGEVRWSLVKQNAK